MTCVQYIKGMRLNNIKTSVGVAFLAAVVIIAGIVLLAGDGSDAGKPAFSVAGQTVSQSTFEHWLEANARSVAGPDRPAGNAAPDAPAFTSCIARQAKLSKIKTPAAGQNKAYKEICKQQYAQLRQQTMQFLINNAWTQAEADRLKVSAPAKDVSERAKQTLKQLAVAAGGSQAKALDRAGLTEADIREQSRLSLLTQIIRQKAFNGPVKRPSDKQARAFYVRHPEMFSRPASRDLQLIGAKTRTQAAAVLAKLRSGAKWETVFKAANQRPVANTPNGRLANVPSGALPPAVDKAAFKAADRAYFGPVNAQGSWVIGQVLKLTAKQNARPYAQIKQQVAQAFQIQQRQDNADQAAEAIRKRFQPQTKCAQDLKVQGCAGVTVPKVAAPKLPRTPKAAGVKAG